MLTKIHNQMSVLASIGQSDAYELHIIVRSDWHPISNSTVKELTLAILLIQGLSNGTPRDEAFSLRD